MDTVERSVLWDIAYRADLEPDEDIRWNYSGRYMYGEDCIGIVTDLPGLLNFMATLATDGRLDPYTFTRVREDNMGRSYIYYWPNIQVVDDEEDEDA